jgi:hypothetical protein
MFAKLALSVVTQNDDEFLDKILIYLLLSL